MAAGSRGDGPVALTALADLTSVSEFLSQIVMPDDAGVIVSNGATSLPGGTRAIDRPAFISCGEMKPDLFVQRSKAIKIVSKCFCLCPFEKPPPLLSPVNAGGLE